MTITLKKYQHRSFNAFDHCMVELMNFIAAIDPLKRARRSPNYSPQYAEIAINKVKKMMALFFLPAMEKKWSVA